MRAIARLSGSNQVEAGAHADQAAGGVDDRERAVVCRHQPPDGRQHKGICVDGFGRRRHQVGCGQRSQV
jgi:hypothetical protein